jgi:hypothetical protein
MTCLGLVAPSETPPKAHARRVSPGVPLGGARVQRNGKPQPESGGTGAGASIFGTAGDNAQLRAIPYGWAKA